MDGHLLLAAEAEDSSATSRQAPCQVHCVSGVAKPKSGLLLLREQRGRERLRSCERLVHKCTPGVTFDDVGAISSKGQSPVSRKKVVVCPQMQTL